MEAFSAMSALVSNGPMSRPSTWKTVWLQRSKVHPDQDGRVCWRAVGVDAGIFILKHARRYIYTMCADMPVARMRRPTSTCAAWRAWRAAWPNALAPSLRRTAWCGPNSQRPWRRRGKGLELAAVYAGRGVVIAVSSCVLCVEWLCGYTCADRCGKPPDMANALQASATISRSQFSLPSKSYRCSLVPYCVANATPVASPWWDRLAQFGAWYTPED